MVGLPFSAFVVSPAGGLHPAADPWLEADFCSCFALTEPSEELLGVGVSVRRCLECECVGFLACPFSEAVASLANETACY